MASTLAPIGKSSPQSSTTASSTLEFAITFDAAKSAAPLDGRLLLLFSTDPAKEPRFQTDGTPKPQIVFGLDVENWSPGIARLVSATNENVFGYPIRRLRDLKPAEYIVQPVLDRYETFKRADGAAT